MPFTVRDGEMSLEVTIPQAMLSELGETLNTFGISYTVERIQQDVETERLLTERQQWLPDEAIERGYYNTPREITLEELAATLDISKSTCSETLHRAEERVVKEFHADDGAMQPSVAVTSD